MSLEPLHTSQGDLQTIISAARRFRWHILVLTCVNVVFKVGDSLLGIIS